MSDYKKLREVGSIDTGFAFPSSSFSTFGTPVVRMSDLDDGNVDVENSARVLPAATQGLDRYKISKGQFLFGLSGSLDAYGTYQDPRDAYLNQRVGRLCGVDESKNSYDYIRHILSSEIYRKHAYLYGSGVAQLNISPSQVESLEFFCPPIPEQRLIARILDTLDTQIQKTEALIAKLEKVKEGLLHDLLTRGIDENGHLRPSPEHAPELYKESPLGLIPREWEVVGFLDAVELPSGQISPLIEPYASLPLIAPDHIEAGVSRLIRVETARDQDAISGKYIVRPGDVVYSKIRPYLRKAWLADIDSICSADMYPLRPKLLTSAILLRIVMSESFSTYANAASMRTGIPKINRDELSGYTFALPTIQEQVRMENIFQGIERKADKEREALSKLVFEKIGLMDDLLTGRVRVTPLLDQAQATTPA